VDIYFAGLVTGDQTDARGAEQVQALKKQRKGTETIEYVDSERDGHQRAERKSRAKSISPCRPRAKERREANEPDRTKN